MPFLKSLNKTAHRVLLVMMSLVGLLTGPLLIVVLVVLVVLKTCK